LPRAEKFTAASKQLKIYEDLDARFVLKPTSGELETVLNDDSVKQSLKFLILTSMGEVPYNPLRGSKIKTLLFDPVDEIATAQLEQSIRDTCKLEPRAEIIDVKVAPFEEKQEYGVTIAFSIVNLTGQTFELGLILKRIR